MRHVRCRVCGENLKRRATSKYVLCQRCGGPACNGCSVTRDFPNLHRWSKSDPETVKETWCRFCVAERVLST